MNRPLCAPAWRHAALATAATLALAACGGGGGGGNDTGGGGDDTQAVKGVLVQPQSTAATSANVLAARQGRERAASAECPDVPDGYDPLASVGVQFLDDASTVLATLTTDDCGGFAGDVPAGATRVSAAPAGLGPIEQPVSSFTGATPTVSSALPANADLVISVLQDLGSGKVALTVSDSVTGKAVLGLGAASFGFAAAGAPVAASGVAYGASTSQSASVSLVLDASGSMYGNVGTTGLTRYQLAAAAAHEMLDGLTSGTDEAGVVVFDDVVSTINDTALANFNWFDGNGVATTPYAFSATGLSSTIASLRTIVDLYNPYSQIYINGSKTDAVHPDTTAKRLSFPLFGGATAYFDATSAGLSLLSGAANVRKIVVALTDGQDNSSAKTVTAVVDEAKAAGVPLYTVGFGTEFDVNEAAMQQMAGDTGGEYKRVEGADLTGLFAGIRTGIRFQYVASFGSAFGAGTVLTTTVTAGGKTVSRDLTIR